MDFCGLFRNLTEIVLDNNPSLVEANFSKKRHAGGELPGCIVFRMNGCPRVDTSRRGSAPDGITEKD